MSHTYATPAGSTISMFKSELVCNSKQCQSLLQACLHDFVIMSGLSHEALMRTAAIDNESERN